MGSPTIFRKHMPWGIGKESVGMIECIFPEYGFLEGGIESSFSGTDWVAKAEFICYSYLYPYIFESRTLTLFEITCPELYTQQSWEWSDAYSWRNSLWKVNFKWVCKKPTGVLMVIWSGFLAPTRAFSKGGPTIFQKYYSSGMGTESLGMIGCIFAENGPLESGIESSFSGTGWGAKGEFRLILGPHSCIFGEAPHHLSKAHVLQYRHRKCGNDRVKIRGELALRRWHWIKFQCTGLGAKGDFRWISGPNPCIFGLGPPPFVKSTCPSV